MTLEEWLEQLPDDERETLCVADGWRAGAEALFSALVDRGYIDMNHVEEAKKRVVDIWQPYSH